MPNWTTNTLLLGGSTESIDFLREALVPEMQAFDFHKILDIPAELKRTASPLIITETQDEADQANQKWNRNRDPAEPKETRAISRAEAARRQTLYGAVDWYAWAVSHWGTKWIGSGLEVLHDSPNAVIIRFDTAWSAPEALLAHLHDQHGLDIVGGAIHEDGDEFELIAHFDRTGLPADAAQQIFDLVFDLIEEEASDGPADDPDTWTWTSRRIGVRHLDPALSERIKTIGQGPSPLPGE